VTREKLVFFNRDVLDSQTTLKVAFPALDEHSAIFGGFFFFFVVVVVVVLSQCFVWASLSGLIYSLQNICLYVFYGFSVWRNMCVLTPV